MIEIPPPDSLIERLRQIGGSQNQHSLVVMPNSFHLNQKLCLDPPGRITLSFSSCTTKTVDFINKDN